MAGAFAAAEATVLSWLWDVDGVVVVAVAFFSIEEQWEAFRHGEGK